MTFFASSRHVTSPPSMLVFAVKLRYNDYMPAQPSSSSSTTAPTLDPTLAHLLELDKHRLQQARVPIVTVSASFKEDLKGWYGLPENEAVPDVVFSRAHYSMSVAIATQLWGSQMDPAMAWIVDPTNYVSRNEWNKIRLTEVIGQTIARRPLLKQAKDLIDRFGRQKLPILKSITPPLEYLFAEVRQPILSMHVAAGNILAAAGKTIIQVVTDPHVRDEYLAQAHRANITFCVFDERTQAEFLEKAALKSIAIDPARVIVTGPPIDPRIIKLRTHKKTWRSGQLNLCITTGGLGTNKTEILQVLKQLLPELRKQHSPYRILVYAATQADIAQAVRDLARDNHIRVADPEETDAEFRLIYHPQIVDANEMLLEYGFPWADGFITKPSGDMAYDAVAAGCFLLTLAEWGEWEHNIRVLFEQEGIARPVLSTDIVRQLTFLQKKQLGKSWIEKAISRSLRMKKSFLSGAKEIANVVLNA